MTRILCDPPLSVGPITGYLHWSAPAPRLGPAVRCSDAGAEWHPAVASQPAHTAHTPAADMVTLDILWGCHQHQQADNNVMFQTYPCILMYWPIHLPAPLLPAVMFCFLWRRDSWWRRLPLICCWSQQNQTWSMVRQLRRSDNLDSLDNLDR